MAFNETANVRRARKNLQAMPPPPLPTARNNPKQKKQLAPFHILSKFPIDTGTTTQLLEEVTQFDYLGLRLDEKLTMPFKRDCPRKGQQGTHSCPRSREVP